MRYIWHGMLETKIISTYILPSVLGIIMLGMGMSLTKEDFKYIFLFPKGMITGLATQMIFLPFAAFVIVWFAPIPDYFKVGLILVAACPGGAVSGLIVHLTGGNVAMSVSFTAINSFLTMLSIPLILNLALATFTDQVKEIQMDVWDTMIHVLFITVIPCIIGIFIRNKFTDFAKHSAKPLKIVMPILLALAMIGAIFFEKKEFEIPVESYSILLPFALLLNFAGLAGGWFIAKKVGLGIRNQVTVSVEVGLQNTAMAISIAVSANLLNNKVYAVPAAMYALFSFFTAVIAAVWIRRKTFKAMLKRKKIIG